MPFYRIEVGDRRSGHAHINFGRSKNIPSACIAPALDYDDVTLFGGRCARMAVALCDAPAGKDLGGKPLTCSAPVCEHHRVKGGGNVDYCPRHAHLAPAALPLEDRS